MISKKKPLIIIAGPTAVGKTELSIDLAKKINGSIISADSMQVYKHMDIGAAKIKKEEMDHIPHYLIDILEPWEKFNITVFQNLAKNAMQKIYTNNRIPIIAGGTGFYIQSVLYDIDFEENNDITGIRERLQRDAAKENGAHLLHLRLKEIDPESAAAIHENNVKRVIRAIEYYELTGQKISIHNESERKKTSGYCSCFFVITDERENLYKRIDQRVDKMIENGLIEEVQNLVKMGCTRDMISMQGLGYKEIIDYLSGDITLSDAIYKIKRDTRHFAKRQLTWFKREKDVIWLDRSKMSKDKIIEKMQLEIQHLNITNGEWSENK